MIQIPIKENPIIAPMMISPYDFTSMEKIRVAGMVIPLIRFGVEVATVARILVPNCSTLFVINTPQYPGTES